MSAIRAPLAQLLIAALVVVPLALLPKFVEPLIIFNHIAVLWRLSK